MVIPIVSDNTLTYAGLPIEHDAIINCFGKHTWNKMYEYVVAFCVSSFSYLVSFSLTVKPKCWYRKTCLDGKCLLAANPPA